MTQLRSTQARELETILADLSIEKAQEVLDFARYLRRLYSPHLQQGSAAAILQSLNEVGPLQFEEGELDMLLAEIGAVR